MSSVNPTLESLVRAEMRRRRRVPGTAVGRPRWARALARGIQRGERRLLARLPRIEEAPVLGGAR